MIEVSRVQRVTATELVVDSIRNAIASGTLKVGDRLPPEEELSHSLGVGRSSLREGMRILSAYGVVEIRQGEGTFVVDRVGEKFLDFMGFLPSEDNLLYALELRRVIEIGNIMAICETITDEQIRMLEDVNDELFKEKDYEENILQDIEFHRLLIKFGGNPLLVRINEMIDKMRRALLKTLFQRKGAASGAAVAHRHIIEALRKRDRDECVLAMKNHLSRTIKDARRLQSGEVPEIS